MQCLRSLLAFLFLVIRLVRNAINTIPRLGPLLLAVPSRDATCRLTQGVVGTVLGMARVNTAIRMAVI